MHGNGQCQGASRGHLQCLLQWASDVPSISQVCVLTIEKQGQREEKTPKMLAERRREVHPLGDTLPRDGAGEQLAQGLARGWMRSRPNP